MLELGFARNMSLMIVIVKDYLTSRWLICVRKTIRRRTPNKFSGFPIRNGHQNLHDTVFDWLLIK